MSYAKRDWYAGLRDELQAEVKLCVNRKRLQGKEGWGTSNKVARSKARKSTVHPIFPMFAPDDEKEGRSLAYHANVAAEMVTRHELGMSLWSDDVADTESFEGVELNRSEREMIGKLIDVANSTTLESLRK